ncbi:hypothetical protein [Paenibacillus silvisoli]|uniref:hypothetical protein n=1 Tax=Paenibacillus silvisoli TaxID=3110539 RepID=UPI00280640C6|nr:hypothetical protein [Paenibacillus silvisoli]
MDRNSLKLMAAAMLLAAMLTGCGSQNGDQQAANDGQAAAAPGFNAGGSNQPDRTADYFAKVVKVSGDSIIVQKSTMSPADMPRGGGGFGGRGGARQNRDGAAQPNDAGAGGDGNAAGGTNGELPPSDGAGERQTPPDDAAAGASTGGNAGGGAPNGDRQGGRFGGGGGFMSQMKFEDAQTTLGVDAGTEIVTMSFGQDGMNENALKASDLKEGDILTVWLSSDNKTAQYISLRFNPGQPGKEGNGQ